MAIEFQSSFRIAAPPSEVMSVMTTYADWPRWMKGLEKVEPLTDGPYGEGTRWRETRRLMGKEAVEEFEVRRFEPPNLVELYVDGRKGTTGKGEYLFLYTLVPEADGGTRLVMDATIDMPGAFTRVLGFMLKGMFKKAIDRDTEAMKAFIESRPSAETEKTTDPRSQEIDAPPAH